MEELLIEGLTPEDFRLIKKIVESYKVSLTDTVSFSDILNVHGKLKEIVDCLDQ